MSGTILGIGPLEILIIVVLVLLVFGPERLPTLMRQAGHTVRRLRNFYVRFATDLRTELTPFEEEIKVLREVTDELRRDLAEIRDAADLRTAIQPITIDASVPASPNSAAAAGSSATPSPVTPAANGSADKAGAEAARPTATAPAQSSVSPAAGPAQPAGAPTPTPPPVSRNGNPPPLAADNPWAQLTQRARADALDDDNPWAAM